MLSPLPPEFAAELIEEAPNELAVVLFERLEATTTAEIIDELDSDTQAEAGTAVGEICCKMGVAEATFHRWKKVYTGMGVAEIRRLKQPWRRHPTKPFDLTISVQGTTMAALPIKFRDLCAVVACLVATTLDSSVSGPANAAEGQPKPQTLFITCNIFDGGNGESESVGQGSGRESCVRDGCSYGSRYRCETGQTSEQAVTLVHSFHGTFASFAKGRKCNLCARNKVQPMSREAHQLLLSSPNSLQTRRATDGLSVC